MKETNLERYGVEVPYQADIIKEKVILTDLKKYGFKSHNQSEIVKQKKRETVDKLVNRPIVNTIREYSRLYGAHISIRGNRNWSRKNDEFLKKLLEELIITFGVIM